MYKSLPVVTKGLSEKCTDISGLGYSRENIKAKEHSLLVGACLCLKLSIRKLAQSSLCANINNRNKQQLSTEKTAKTRNYNLKK